jgi:hypothetical protein
MFCFSTVWPSTITTRLVRFRFFPRTSVRISVFHSSAIDLLSLRSLEKSTPCSSYIDLNLAVSSKSFTDVRCCFMSEEAPSLALAPAPSAAVAEADDAAPLRPPPAGEGATPSRRMMASISASERRSFAPSSKMLGGASQIVSKIRVTRNGT